MWFKNLILFRFNKAPDFDIEQLESALAEFTFSPCGSQDISKFGWVEPLGKHGQTFCHGAGNELLICAKKEEKILPSTVIRDEMQEKIEAIEAEQQRPLKKAEKQAIKEDITLQLLPRAFKRSSLTFAWISLENRFIAVDASSAKKAEEVISLLRKSLGSLPVTPVNLNTPADVTMTEWLVAGQAPATFELGEQAELRSALEHGGIISCKEQNLLSDEIRAHLDADKMVTKLALDFDETVSFVLGDDFTIKRLKFSDVVKDQNEDVGHDDFAARFDADFALVTGELCRLFPALIDALGGEAKSIE
jgi:recombination associated protein RdgC